MECNSFKLWMYLQPVFLISVVSQTERNMKHRQIDKLFIDWTDIFASSRCGLMRRRPILESSFGHNIASDIASKLRCVFLAELNFTIAIACMHADSVVFFFRMRVKTCQCFYALHSITGLTFLTDAKLLLQHIHLVEL